VNDMNVMSNPEYVLKMIKGYQHSDATGEVCPAEWMPGMSGIDLGPNGR
jgi:alkyl hydroperoxide reductase subunit AhpC